MSKSIYWLGIVISFCIVCIGVLILFSLSEAQITAVTAVVPFRLLLFILLFLIGGIVMYISMKGLCIHYSKDKEVNKDIVDDEDLVELEDVVVNEPGLQRFYEVFLSLRDNMKLIADNKDGVIALLDSYFKEKMIKNAVDDDSHGSDQIERSPKELLSRMDLMVELTRSLLQCTGRSSILEAVITMGAALSKSRRASVMVLNSDKDGLILHSVHGWKPDEKMADNVIPLADSVAGRVIKNGERLFVTDVTQDLGRASRTGYTTSSFLILPIKAGKDIIGVLNLTEKENDEIYGIDDLELLNYLLNQSALALL